MDNPAVSEPELPAQTHPQWQVADVEALYHQPFHDLLHQAQQVHRRHFDPNEVQLSTLMNIKSGGCPEDCAYCPQSARHSSPVESEQMVSIAEVRTAAQAAKDAGATRFCMGAAWRSPRGRDFARAVEMVQAVRDLGMESCATLGMLTDLQAKELADAGLDYYNHNLDTSAEFYTQIITTRTYADRLATLGRVRNAGIKVCCGGIIGMGESVRDRSAMLVTLTQLPRHPESVPINMLVRAPGTPLAQVEELDPLDMVRTIAVARILMPTSRVRLSAGRSNMDDALQALCFHAGANSIFYGDRLLTTENPGVQQDLRLLDRLGMVASR
jgi:biotin synthase